MAINNQVKQIDSKIEWVEHKIEYGEKRRKELKEEQKELERELEELKIAREEAIKESESSLDIGQVLFLYAFGAFLTAAGEIYSLPKDKQEELDKRVARNMFDKAVQGKITRPYDEEEIQFMMEHLK